MKKIIIGLLFGQCFVIPTTSFAEPSERQIESLVFTCFTCHGPQGVSAGEIPSINELSAKEITEKLSSFRRDQGEPTIMNRIAKGYSEDEITQIADYLAELK